MTLLGRVKRSLDSREEEVVESSNKLQQQTVKGPVSWDLVTPSGEDADCNQEHKLGEELKKQPTL